VVGSGKRFRCQEKACFGDGFWLRFGAKRDIELSTYWTQTATHVHFGSQRYALWAVGKGMASRVSAAPNILEANSLDDLSGNGRWHYALNHQYGTKAADDTPTFENRIIC